MVIVGEGGQRGRNDTKMKKLMHFNECIKPRDSIHATIEGNQQMGLKNGKWYLNKSEGKEKKQRSKKQTHIKQISEACNTKTFERENLIKKDK